MRNERFNFNMRVKPALGGSGVRAGLFICAGKSIGVYNLKTLAFFITD